MKTALSSVRQGLLTGLINTRHVPDGDDVLSDDRALGWLAERGATGVRVEPTALERLRDLREGLRQLALANNGHEPDLEVLDRARTALSEVGLFAELGDQERVPGLHAAQGAGPARQVMARIATAYLAERAGGGWSRVKACAAPACRYAYVDVSRNGSRRWCDMAECGNRAKNRSWRARQDAARNPSGRVS